MKPPLVLSLAVALVAGSSAPTYRGSNYIRLSGPVAAGAVGASSSGYHCTFSPLYYSAIRPEAQQALANMGANHYDLVRVFLDHGTPDRNDSVAGNFATDTLVGARVISFLAVCPPGTRRGVGVPVRRVRTSMRARARALASSRGAST
jgi:hypothetical protein